MFSWKVFCFSFSKEIKNIMHSKVKPYGEAICSKTYMQTRRFTVTTTTAITTAIVIITIITTQ